MYQSQNLRDVSRIGFSLNRNAFVSRTLSNIHGHFEKE